MADSYVLGQWKAPIDGRVRQLNYRANLERRIDCQQELIGITTFILTCFRFTGIKVSLLMDQLFASSSESCSSLKNRCVIDSDKSAFLFIGLEVKLSELFFPVSRYVRITIVRSSSRFGWGCHIGAVPGH